jgi:hypothetical protein
MRNTGYDKFASVLDTCNSNAGTQVVLKEPTHDLGGTGTTVPLNTLIVRRQPLTKLSEYVPNDLKFVKHIIFLAQIVVTLKVTVRLSAMT